MLQQRALYTVMKTLHSQFFFFFLSSQPVPEKMRISNHCISLIRQHCSFTGLGPYVGLTRIEYRRYDILSEPVMKHLRNYNKE